MQRSKRCGGHASQAEYLQAEPLKIRRQRQQRADKLPARESRVFAVVESFAKPVRRVEVVGEPHTDSRGSCRVQDLLQHSVSLLF
jgi:hypothetical protein